MKREMAIILLIVALIGLVGCNSKKNNPVSTGQSKEQTATQTATQTVQTKEENKPTKLADVVAVTSDGGLGDTFEQINKSLGAPTKTNQEMQNGTGEYVYLNDLYTVSFSEGRAISIAMQVDPKQQVMTLANALDKVKKMIPQDSVLINKTDRDSMETIYVYNSKTLESLFDSSKFDDGTGKIQPGEFAVQIIYEGDNVQTIALAVGANN